jgi:MFS family permease
MPLPDPPAPSLMQHRSFVLFWLARTSTTAATQMLGVGVGWQLYELTGNPLDLGIVGLMQFVPVVGLALLVGQTADRFDRRVVARSCQITKATVAVCFLLGTAGGWLSREVVFTLMFVIGCARAFENPTMHALVPGIVPQVMLPRAIAASASANQTAVICGPAIGGLIYGAFGPVTVYIACTLVFAAAATLVSMLHAGGDVHSRRPVTVETVFAGLTYIWRRPVILGAISLDMCAVLLGGVTALLPIFARDYLHTGPWGLGLLRSSPAVGALLMSIFLSRYSIERNAGKIMIATVMSYGAAIVVFGLSSWLILSMLALVAMGASDSISVIIRHSLVQTRTPNDMLGRVMAVNSMFTGTSSTLGEFRAGVVASMFGATASVLMGGFGAILIALLWMRLFTELYRVDSIVRKH